MEFSDFYFDLLQGLVEGKDLPFFARKLVEKIARPVIITNALQFIVASHDQRQYRLPDIDMSALLRADECQNDANDMELLSVKDMNLKRTSWYSGETRMEGFQRPLAVQGRVWGYIYVISANDLTESETKYLWETALAVLLILKHLGTQQEEREQYQDEFIRDILYNNYDSLAAIMAKARTWDWNLNGSWALMVTEIDQDKIKLAKHLVPCQPVQGRKPLTSIINEQLLVLLPLPGSEKKKNRDTVNNFIKQLLAIFKRYEIENLEFGIGSFTDSVNYLYKVFQEAKIAMVLGGVFALDSPYYFAEMGVLKFVFNQSAYELQEFSQNMLGDLFAYDRENESELVHTLHTYLETRFQIPKCAKLMYIHENTLRNRIGKIEQLTGLDLHRIDHLTNLYIALQIAKIGQQNF